MRLRLSRERSRGHGQSSSWDQAAQGPADQGMALLFTGVRCRWHETVAVQGGSSRACDGGQILERFWCGRNAGGAAGEVGGAVGSAGQAALGSGGWRCRVLSEPARTQPSARRAAVLRTRRGRPSETGEGSQGRALRVCGEGSEGTSKGAIQGGGRRWQLWR